MFYGAGVVGVSVGVSVAVGVADACVAPPVAVAVEVVEALPLTTMTTYTSSPKLVPAAVAILQLPRWLPDAFGAVMATDISVSVPGLTALSIVRVAPPIASPPMKLNLNPDSQAQVPLFLTRQVLVNVCPGFILMLSGMVTSATKAIL